MCKNYFEIIRGCTLASPYNCVNFVHECSFFYQWRYCDKICVYDEHPIASRDIQCRAPDSRSSNYQLITYYLCMRYLLRIQQYCSWSWLLLTHKDKRDLLALYLSRTYCHRTSTWPPSCVTPQQPTINTVYPHHILR